MSEDKKASGQTEVVSDNQEQEQSTVTAEKSVKEDKVSYDTYKKVLAEAKKAKELAKQYEEKVQEFEQSQMQSSGKQNELIESLRKQLTEKEKSIVEFKTNYAKRLLTSAVEAEGTKHGCVDTDLLLKSMDLNAIEFGDDFSVNMDDVQREVAAVVNKKPFLFTKKVGGINDVNPKVNKESLNGKKDISKMSLNDQIALIAKATAAGNFTQGLKK